MTADAQTLMSFIAGSTLGTVGAQALRTRAGSSELNDLLAIPRHHCCDLLPSFPERSAQSRTDVKVLITGGFGVGKTTMVSAASHITPVTTESTMCSAAVGVDDSSKVPAKSSTTTCLDYGQAMLGDGLVLHLFGTPGQTRFWFMWDELLRGSIAAVVLVDTRRLADSFAAIDFFESRGLPYMVALNQFDGAKRYEPREVCEALALPEGIKVVSCDARSRESSRQVLIELIEVSLGYRRASREGGSMADAVTEGASTS